MDVNVPDLMISGTKVYTDSYKDEVFHVWYNSGKISARELYDRIPIPTTNFGKKPSLPTLAAWINDLFSVRAANLDAGVRETMDKALIASKVEMLQRHIAISRRMQDLAIEFLEEHKDDLSTPAAVRLLVASIEIERDSAGIPQMLEKMSQKTDEQLLDEVKKLIEESPIEFERDDDG